jgi:HAD superfamily phosphatase
MPWEMLWGGDEMTTVLFDMDGVLVDVSRSYLAAIQKTVEYFLEETLMLSEIQEYRNRGGLNNDWDLTQCILKERGKPVDRKVLIEIFQGIYLGNEFDGLIKNEKWLLRKHILDRLAESYPMGIVTGRPQTEASYVLHKFGVKEYFSALICLDDVPPDKHKPDPFGILMALQQLSAESGVYIGDTVDDMTAARKAGVDPIGVIPPGSDKHTQRKVLIRSGASCVLKDINDVLEVLA